MKICEPGKMQAVSGFTFIELIIVVAIVSILAAVAVPAYNNYVIEGRRAEGKAFAMDIAARQERHYTQFGEYTNKFSELGMTTNTSENNLYNARLQTSSGGSSFTIRVVPLFADKECGMIQLKNTGERKNIQGSGTDEECWR